MEGTASALPYLTEGTWEALSFTIPPAWKTYRPSEYLPVMQLLKVNNTVSRSKPFTSAPTDSLNGLLTQPSEEVTAEFFLTLQLPGFVLLCYPLHLQAPIHSSETVSCSLQKLPCSDALCFCYTFWVHDFVHTCQHFRNSNDKDLSFQSWEF